MDRSVLREKIALFRRELEQMERINQGCGECAHFAAQGRCTRWAQAVPKEAQADGCDDWHWDGIPF